MQGRIGDARTANEEYLGISRTLLALNPSSTQAKRDVMVSHVKLAELPNGDAHLRAALLIAEEMVRDGVLAPSDQRLLEQLRAEVKTLDPGK